MGKLKYVVLSVVFCVVAVLTQSDSSSADEGYYAGKTITVYVGRGPGSGTDIAVRLFASFWREHIPGRPQVIVKNIPGGGGTRVWNYGYEIAASDGLTILFSPFSGTAEILGLPGLRADFSSMPLIGGLRSPNMMYVRTAKVESLDALLTVSGLKYAGQNPAHHYDILGRLALDMLGVDYKYISGFSSANEAYNAIRRREADIQTAGITLYRFSIEETLVETGEAIALWHNPWLDPAGNIVAEESAIGIPTFVEVYTELKGAPPAGEMFEIYKWLQPTINTFGQAAFLPPDTPEEAVKILRESFVATANDPAYRAQEQKAFRVRMPLIEHEEGTRVIREMTNAPKNVRALLTHYAKPDAR